MALSKKNWQLLGEILTSVDDTLWDDDTEDEKAFEVLRNATEGEVSKLWALYLEGDRGDARKVFPAMQEIIDAVKARMGA